MRTWAGLRHSVSLGFLLLLATSVAAGTPVAPGYHPEQLEPWPLLPWDQSDTSLSQLTEVFQKNLSGSHWDGNQQQLLLVVNKPGLLVILQYVGNTFYVRHTTVIEGDPEAVTRLPSLPQDVFVLEEEQSRIIWLSPHHQGNLRPRQYWQLASHLPNRGGMGAEGLTFLPWSSLTDLGLNTELLQRRSAFPGLFCVAHQNGGHLYFFLLGRDSTVQLLLTVPTGRAESSGLEYDSQTGLLYIWHNIEGNSLEIVRLKHSPATDRLLLVRHFQSPKGGNLESVAIANEGMRSWLFLTDDDNQDNTSILWYRNWLRADVIEGR